MNKQDVYQLLEEKMLGYTDYADVPVHPVDEPMVALRRTRNLAARQMDARMHEYTGDKVFVRQDVAKRLTKAAKLLVAHDASLQLEVIYGYRAQAIQQKLFEKFKREHEGGLTGHKLLEAVHRLIAVPDVAGHPAGAAVDLQIIREGKPVDMGTNIWEFTPDSFTFSPFISREGWRNRQLLRRVMLEAGFAPFDGEWWHFSYGDKEWARYYDQPAALYGQLDFSVPK